MASSIYLHSAVAEHADKATRRGVERLGLVSRGIPMGPSSPSSPRQNNTKNGSTRRARSQVEHHWGRREIDIRASRSL